MKYAPWTLQHLFMEKPTQKYNTKIEVEKTMVFLPAESLKKNDT